MKAETISADELCGLTGLTDRRHRQLAKAGYFPPPKASQYQREETLRGLFRYFQESKHAGQALKDRKTEQEILKLDLENKRRLAKLIPFDEVEGFMVGIVSAAKAEARRLELELPPKLIGLERAEAEVKIREEMDRLFANLAELAGKLPELKADAENAEDEPAHDADNDAGLPRPIHSEHQPSAAADSVGVGRKKLSGRANQ